MRATVVLRPSGVTLRRFPKAKVIDGAPVVCGYHFDNYDLKCEACKAIIRSAVLLEERATAQQGSEATSDRTLPQGNSELRYEAVQA